MKTQLTKENKKKFFAHYWEQEVMIALNGGYKPIKIKVDGTSFERYFGYRYTWLELTPLSMISDDQIKNICKILKVDPNEAGYDKSWQKLKTEIQSGTTIETILSLWDFYGWAIHVIDYLRSEGVAISWMGLSVEEMVEAGWIKLKYKT